MKMGEIRKMCATCKDYKPLKEFGNRKNVKSGLRYSCKVCVNKRNKAYRRTPDGLVSEIYRHQKATSKSRGHSPPDYTLGELKEWVFSRPHFNKLYNNWVESGYSRDLSPSCDRKDDYKLYTFCNIQLVTWQQNRKTAHYNMRNGINNKQNKPVVGVHKITGERLEFCSISEASRKTKADRGWDNGVLRRKKKKLWKI